MLNRLSTTKRKHVTPDDGYQKIYRDLQKRMYGMLDSVGARREPTWKK
jgi:hypothetical protein